MYEFIVPNEFSYMLIQIKLLYCVYLIYNYIH